MLKLVCFPHYTCGGLLCSILNKTAPDNSATFNAANGGLVTSEHQIGKIGDSDTVYTTCSADKLLQQVKSIEDKWISTHCWPNAEIVDISSQIINVTTVTSRSKVYRWLRSYHHYFKDSQPWQGLSSVELLDKSRETAKNYLVPFDVVHHPKVTNIEFADIVENNASFSDMAKLYPEVYYQWKDINSFLYDDNIWNYPATQSFYQAEFEVLHDNYYRYTNA